MDVMREAINVILKPMLLLVPTALAVSGSGNVITRNISMDVSPFKDWNLPTLKWGIVNGTKPTNVKLINTFGSKLQIQLTYPETVTNPYSEIIVRLD